MDKIIIKHSSIHITNYSLGDCNKLEYMFSIYDQLTHKRYFKGILYDEDKRILYVPRGMDINYLESITGKKAIVDMNSDPKDKISDVSILFKPRDEVQQEGTSFLIGEGKHRSNQVKSQLGLHLNTGKGKSYCTILANAYLKYRACIITSSISWLEQWKKYVLDYTDIREREIYMLVGTPSIHMLLKKDMSQYKYILASHDTIKAYGTKFGWDAVSKLFKHMKIGIKVFDEAHLGFDNMCLIDAYTNTFKTFYVTATPGRSDSEENVIYKYYFRNVPSIDLFDDDVDPHTHYIEMRYNSHPSIIDISDCSGNYGFDKNTYSAYVANKPNFHKLLHVLIDVALRNGKKNVFYIATNKAIFRIYDWIMYEYPELRNDVGIYTSEIKVNKEAQLDKRIILSTTSSLGTAQDIKGLKMVVVLAEPFKSEILARQSLGRTRDNDTYYIEVVDTGFQSIKKYAKDKAPIYNKYALSMSSQTLSDTDLDNRVRVLQDARTAKYMHMSPFVIRNDILRFDYDYNADKTMRSPFTIPIYKS